MSTTPAGGESFGRNERPVASAAANDSTVSRLARLFPTAISVRIPVSVSGGEIGDVRVCEKTVIEYGTPQEVLFASSLPLEFADRLHLRNADGSLEAEVSVVALQYCAGSTAVAARFVENVVNWIIKA